MAGTRNATPSFYKQVRDSYSKRTHRERQSRAGRAFKDAHSYTTIGVKFIFLHVAGFWSLFNVRALPNRYCDLLRKKQPDSERS